MNLLIVDDDKYVLEGVVNGIEWSSLPIDNIYTAVGTYQARDILLKYQIDILLCDIEIPNESGLDLVEWIREHEFAIHVIFFTSFADFSYAQRAIQLKSFDYILKPVAYEKLAEVLLRACKAVEQQKDHTKYQKIGKYWFSNQDSRKENFWEKLLTRRKPFAAEEIYELVDKEMLDYKPEEEFLVLAVDFHSERMTEAALDQNLYSNKIRKLLEKFFTDKKTDIEVFLQVTVLKWYLVLRFRHRRMEKEYLREIGKAVLDTSRNGIGVSGSLYYSEIVSLEGIYDQMERIKEMYFHNLGFREDVFFTDDFKKRKISYQKPDMKQLELLLSLEEEEKATTFIEEYLNYHSRYYELNKEILQCFLFDIMQSIFSLLREKQIEAHQLFDDANTRQLYEKALDSITDMNSYVNHLICRSIEYGKYIGEPDNVIDKIVRYIDEHLNENITRSDLAQLVYLNPDYMARLFKSERGIPLVTYINNKRMDKARELLLTTKEPICVIASKTGFPTNSYFSKKFKEYYGVLPADFKKSGMI